MRQAIGLGYSLERRLPASSLLITPSVDLANSVYGTLERELASRVWVWQESSVESALRVLGVCRFRLILLDMAMAEALAGSVLRALKEVAPETPLILLAVGSATPLGIERAGLGAARLRLSGATAVAPRGDAGALVRAVREILATPLPNPPDSA